MTLLILLVVVVLVVSVEGSKCSKADRAIWVRNGHLWPHQFRQYGGLWTSQSSYEEQVVAATGLTRTCATCYGEAYICGYSNCKWSCATEGPSCDSCLVQEGCIGNCNQCTGFK